MEARYKEHVLCNITTEGLVELRASTGKDSEKSKSRPKDRKFQKKVVVKTF